MDNPKPSRPCQDGETVILQGLPRDVHMAIMDAFDAGVEDDQGVTVRLECSVAQQLVFALSTSMQTNYEGSGDGS